MENADGDHSSTLSPQTYFWLCCMIVVYAASRVLQVFPFRVPMLAIIALHVLPPIVFASIHGAIRYGIRGILAFFAICVLVGNVVENIGVLTGFPFGHYYFTGVMGPKIFQIPVFLGLAYLGMGYLSWTTAEAILGSSTAMPAHLHAHPSHTHSFRRESLPLSCGNFADIVACTVSLSGVLY